MDVCCSVWRSSAVPPTLHFCVRVFDCGHECIRLSRSLSLSVSLILPLSLCLSLRVCVCVCVVRWSGLDKQTLPKKVVAAIPIVFTATGISLFHLYPIVSHRFICISLYSLLAALFLSLNLPVVSVSHCISLIAALFLFPSLPVSPVSDCISLPVSQFLSLCFACVSLYLSHSTSIPIPESPPFPFLLHS